MKKSQTSLLRAASATAFLLVSLTGISSHAQILGFFGQNTSVDPYRSWKVIETKNFEIIYDSNEAELAQKIAAESERALGFLQPLLRTGTKQKTVIVLADTTDSSNGLATSFPRPTVILYPVLPVVNDSTSEYYDWYRELVQHELTHINNFEPTSGVFGVLHTIFGSIAKPNAFLPRWYTEGLAVEMESLFTPVGRGRSHFYSALGRALEENEIWGEETIDRINSTAIPTWPRGQRPYYYGYFLLRHLSEIKNSSSLPGEQVYGLLNENYGRHMPWFINGPSQEVFGKSYQSLLEDMYTKYGGLFSSQLDSLKASGAKNGTLIAQSGYFVKSARISPNGLQMAAIISTLNDDPGLQIWTRPNTSISFTSISEGPRLLKNGKHPIENTLSWRSDSKTLVYDRLEPNRHYSSYSDLFELDTTTGHEHRLTHGLRAREPAVLPDGTLTFVISGNSRTSLWKADSQAKNLVQLYEPPFGHRVSTPRFFKYKGRDSIIYSHRDDQGKEWIETITLNSTHEITPLTRVTQIGEIHMMPAVDPTDLESFYFSASTSGVLNLYKWKNSIIRPISNVTTYASSPELDPWTKEVIYSRLTSTGVGLESLSLREVNSNQKNSMAKIAPFYEYPEAEETPAPKIDLVTGEKDYSGLGYLFPQYWMPWVNFVPGGLIFDASTSGNDPLNIHQYTLDIGYDTRALKPTETFSYTNGSQPFLINTYLTNQYLYLAGLGTTEHIAYASINTQHHLQEDDNNWTLSPVVSYKLTDYPGYLFTEMGPGVSVTYSDITPQKDYEISPESGYALTVGYNYMTPIGNTSYHNLNADGVLFLSGRPLPKRNVIKLHAAAWVSPPQPTILTGSQQAGGEYGSPFFIQQFIVRGYPYGEFIGSSLYNGNFEYRIPLSYPFSGAGTAPFFVNNLQIDLVADVLTLYGGRYDSGSGGVLVSTRLDSFYGGAGAELKGDFQLFYGIPITMKLGYYYGFNTAAYGGSSLFLGFSTTL